MREPIPYLQWKERIDAHTPGNCRVGNDSLIVKQPRETDFIDQSFRLDMTLSVFLASGHCTFMADWVEYEAQAPCLFTVMPGQIFQLITLSDEATPYTIIMSEAFSASLFKEYGSFGSLHRSIVRQPVIDLTHDSQAFTRYLDMLEALLQSPFNTFKLEAVRHLSLAMFYSYSYKLHDISEVTPATKQENLFQQFMLLLKRHYQTEREVAFYASQLCITPKYLSVIVKQQTGQTALACIETHVVTECKALLLSTDLNIQQIADRLHFPSQSVFGKFFKRVTGLSPRAYRKQHTRL